MGYHKGFNVLGYGEFHLHGRQIFLGGASAWFHSCPRDSAQRKYGVIDANALGFAEPDNGISVLLAECMYENTGIGSRIVNAG